jgi:hypothetical protein
MCYARQEKRSIVLFEIEIGTPGSRDLAKAARFGAGRRTDGYPRSSISAN